MVGCQDAAGEISCNCRRGCCDFYFKPANLLLSLCVWDLAELIQLTEGRQRISERLVSRRRRLAVVSFSTVSQHRHSLLLLLLLLPQHSGALLAAPHQLPSARRFGPNCARLSAPAIGVSACVCALRWLCLRTSATAARGHSESCPTDAIQAGPDGPLSGRLVGCLAAWLPGEMTAAALRGRSIDIEGSEHFRRKQTLELAARQLWRRRRQSLRRY